MSSARMNTVMETDGEKKERNIRPFTIQFDSRRVTGEQRQADDDDHNEQCGFL